MIDNMSQEGYFVNGQGLVVYFSLLRLLVGFEYYLSARKIVNKWLYEEWKVCTHILQ